MDMKTPLEPASIFLNSRTSINSYNLKTGKVTLAEAVQREKNSRDKPKKEKGSKEKYINNSTEPLPEADPVTTHIEGKSSMLNIVV